MAHYHKTYAERLRDCIRIAPHLAPDEKAELEEYLHRFHCQECLNDPIDGHDNLPFCTENYKGEQRGYNEVNRSELKEDESTYAAHEARFDSWGSWVD